MKKMLLLAATFAASALALQAQVAKRIMVEEFTQASCGPCATQNPAFNALLKTNYDKLVSLKYQTSWPGVDPMNAQNPGEVQTRVDYYKVSGVPYSRINGSIEPTGANYSGAPANVSQATIDAQAALTTPLEVRVSHSLSSALDSITITCVVKNVTNTDFSAGSLRIRIGIVEKEVRFATAPGTNGEKDFYNVMRKMLPNADGTTVAGDKIKAGDSIVLNFNEFLPFYIYKYDQLGVVVFVQSDNTKEVFQANFSEPKALSGSGYGNVSITQGSTLPNPTTSGYCFYDVVPRATVRNVGTQPVTSFKLRYSLGNTTVDTLWQGSLAANASQIVTFPTAKTTPGKASFSISLLSVNGSRDTFGFNNYLATQTITTLSDKPFATKLFQEFESVASGSDVPNTIQVKSAVGHLVVVSREALGRPWIGRLGAFENSDKSLRFAFWNMSANTRASLIYEKFNLSNATKPAIFFNHAYTQFTDGVENDKLEVQVSTDCGKTWTNVWAKSGNDLKTAPVVGNDTLPFFPKAADWVYDQADLSSVAGMGEVNIRFLGTSAFGDMLYVDNIEIRDVATGINDPGKLDGRVFVYPNPASEEVFVDLNLAEETRLSVRIFDLAGKLVQSLAENTSFPTGLHKLQWEPANTGLYLLKVQSKDGEITQKISVVK